MITLFGLEISMKLFFHLMVSFAFFIGIVLLISPEAFEALNKALQREYGLRTRVIPTLEDTTVDIVDQIIIKNRTIAGLIIAVTAFILLLLYP